MRTDINPIFHEVLKAIGNNLDNNISITSRFLTEAKRNRVNFSKPTNNPRGYYSILKFVIENPNCHRKDILKSIKRNKFIYTIERLVDSELIEYDYENHTFKPTSLGIIYHEAAKPYVK